MTQKGKNDGKLANSSCDTKKHKTNVDDRATDHFLEEILVHILSRLPVRSLLRFKYVSKLWKTLISDPYFSTKHFNCAKNDQDFQKLLIYQRCPKYGIFSIYCCPLSPVKLVEDVEKLKLECPSYPKPTTCTIHCCYDGLAIIQVNDYDCVKLLLWNPSIRESIVLPALEFPRIKGTSRFGLGYDSTRGEYKILHIHEKLYNHSGCKCQVHDEILALKGGSWRRIDENPRDIICSLVHAMHSLAFVHAAFHWIIVSRNCFEVVSFSISNEVYGEIPLSKEILSLSLGYARVGVCVLEGMLCFHSNSISQRKNTLKLWVLKEYGVKGSWMPFLTIEDSWISNVSPTYRFADGDVLLWCKNAESKENAFRTCNGPFESWPRCDTIQGGHAFTESLISPKSLTY